MRAEDSHDVRVKKSDSFTVQIGVADVVVEIKKGQTIRQAFEALLAKTAVETGDFEGNYSPAKMDDPINESVEIVIA